MTKVKCEACGRLLSNINNTHLASHNLTAAQYRVLYPDAPMMSQEHADKLSARSIASNQTRKGIPRSDLTRQRMREGQARYNATHERQPRGPMSDGQKRLLSELALQRYANGFVHPNQDKHLPTTVRQKISDTLTGRIVGPEAAYKALKAKRLRGYDLAFFRGRNHTDASKAQIGATLRAQTNANRLLNRGVMLERMNEAKLSLLNSISDNLFHLRCNVCYYEFTRTPQCFHPSKFHLHICDQCFPKSPVSNQENEVADFVRSLSDTRMIRSDMEVLSPLELDIYLPEKNIAIEYCGLYWHSELCGKTRWYHRHKFDVCRDKGIRLITIFEDEWVRSRAIVESMLRNALCSAVRSIAARSCTVRPIARHEAGVFLHANHLQGHGRSTVKLGLFYVDELVAVMSFADSGLSRRSTGWEIDRFCSKLGLSIPGAASKLFATFVDQYHPYRVTSYADLRWGDGNVYQHLGFIHIGNTVPNYWYLRANDLKRYHRFSLRKKPSEAGTERELRRRDGWFVIWDCGHAKWIYNAI